MSTKSIIQLQSATDPKTRLVLSEVSVAITEFDSTTRDTVQDLLDTIASEKIAIGLAAPQIGIFKRVFVIDLKTDPSKDPLVAINPKITSISGKKDTKLESCMSVPHIRGPVERRHNVELEYQDLSGHVQHLSATGFLARAIMHEIDHLDGLLYLDRMSPEAKTSSVDFFKKG